MLSPVEVCRSVVDAWERLSTDFMLLGPMALNLPIACQIPTLDSVRTMGCVVEELLGSVSEATLADSIVDIISGNHSDCYLILSGKVMRVAVHVLQDGTSEFRYYVRGKFICGVVYWPDGHKSDMLYEPAEII